MFLKNVLSGEICPIDYDGQARISDIHPPK